jgi:D-sedoheptulose 7-phosphate isomerase
MTKGAFFKYFKLISEIGQGIQITDLNNNTIESQEAMDCAVDIVNSTKSSGGRIFFIGNGGSAGISTHMATDWLKNGGFTTLCFNEGSLLTCLGNDLGFENVFSTPVSRHVRVGDVLVAISSSGESKNIIQAVDCAIEKNAFVITLSGFSPSNSLRRKGSINFYVPNNLYGFVEIAHLSICHAILDTTMGWK